MSYVVNKSDGEIVAVVADGTVDTSSTSINLVGRGTQNYGEYIAENEVRMLENFALATPPTNPLVGQLWYDTPNQLMKTFNGTSWDSPVTTSYYSTITDTTGTASITITNDAGITVGATSSAALLLSGGNAYLQTDTPTGSPVNALTINPATGAVTVLANPTSNLGIVTKQYNDTYPRVGPDANNQVLLGSNSLVATLSGTAIITASSAGGTLTGVWNATNTPSVETSNLQLATTAFVQNNKASPVFTGVPTAPTASTATNTTQLATTAFVQNNKVSPVFTGVPTAPTATLGTNTTQLATTAFVSSRSAADKVSPVFTGVPAAPTASLGTSTTQLATTAFVANGLANLSASVGIAYAPINSPTFTGVPITPTVAEGDATGKIASTSYVITATEKWAGSRKFVSTLDPSGAQGNDGDFWFKVI